MGERPGRRRLALTSVATPQQDPEQLCGCPSKQEVSCDLTVIDRNVDRCRSPEMFRAAIMCSTSVAMVIPTEEAVPLASVVPPAGSDADSEEKRPFPRAAGSAFPRPCKCQCHNLPLRPIP